MATFILCDDNKEYIIYLHKILKTYITEKDNIVSYTSEKDLMHDIHLYEYDSIFILDIVLEKQSGVELAKLINEKVPTAVIIYLSGYLDKVVDIFDTKHCYFIYKQELEQRLPTALQKAMHALQNNKQTLLIVLNDKKILKSVESIRYMERIRRYTFIHCTDEIYRITTQLEELKKTLPHHFIQCHRSYFINLEHVNEYKRTEFILDDKTIIPISRSFSKQVQKSFQNFLTKAL